MITCLDNKNTERVMGKLENRAVSQMQSLGPKESSSVEKLTNWWLFKEKPFGICKVRGKDTDPAYPTITALLEVQEHARENSFLLRVWDAVLRGGLDIKEKLFY